MQVELLALTRRNPALTQSSLADLGDLPALFEGKSTYGEAIMEFAGRVCYRSTHRMGTAPEFIVARVREGHEDIIEHVVVTVRIRNSVRAALLAHAQPPLRGDGRGRQRVDRQRQHARLARLLSPRRGPGGAADLEGGLAGGLCRI